MAAGPAMTLPTLPTALVIAVPIPEVKTALSPSSPGWPPRHPLLATVTTVPITREDRVCGRVPPQSCEACARVAPFPRGPGALGSTRWPPRGSSPTRRPSPGPQVTGAHDSGIHGDGEVAGR